MDHLLNTLLTLVYIYFIISTISVILLENRNPSRSLAWIIVLIVFPVLGILSYFLIGQNYRKHKIINRKLLKLNDSRALFSFKPESLDNFNLKSHHRQLIQLLYINSDSTPFTHNHIKVLSDGSSTFESMFECISNAREHIHLEFFIFGNDKISNQLRELLISKAKQGVRIRMIYDYFGSYFLTGKYLKSLRDAGIYVRPFLPLNLRLGRNRINFRNHRKLVIIDGQTGFTGGLNVADRYVFGNRLGKWRDTFVKFEGSIVHGLQLQFLADWNFVEKKLITDSKYYPALPQYKKNVIQIVGSGPDYQWESIMQGIAFAISTAKNYIYIHTPYFVPNEVIMQNIQMAAMSGIDVRMMIPLKSDSRLTDACSFSYYGDILEAGVKIYVYEGGFLHSKAIVIDDFISVIGSANLDERSFNLNFEANAFIYEEKTAMDLRNLFEKDLESCKPLTLAQWQNRSRRQKMKESMARLFSPII